MRHILNEDSKKTVTELLQKDLATLLDTSLQLKQAHWNLRGDRFRSVHLQLDEIVETTRDASDEVAERIATLNVAADGRADTITRSSKLDPFPAGFLPTGKVIDQIADRLLQLIKSLRESIEKVGDHDPITEDLLIGIAAGVEKHLWMLQSQQDEA